jgi:hypothetical protein
MQPSNSPVNAVPLPVAPRLFTVLIASLLLALLALGMTSKPSYAASATDTPEPSLYTNGATGPTVTIVDSSPNPAPMGATVVYTMTVTGNGGPTPTGIVELWQGGAYLGVGVLSNGLTTFSYPNIFGQTIVTLTAHYLGDVNYSQATSPAYTQTFYPLQPQLTLTSVASTSSLSETVTLNVSMALTTPLLMVPSAPLVFYSGTQPLCTTLLIGFFATCQTNALAVGQHTLTAEFAGDLFFQSATSNPLSHEVTQGTTTIAATSTRDSVLVGEGVTLSATVTPITTTNPAANLVCDPMNPITCIPPIVPTRLRSTLPAHLLAACASPCTRHAHADRLSGDQAGQHHSLLCNCGRQRPGKL